MKEQLKGYVLGMMILFVIAIVFGSLAGKFTVDLNAFNCDALKPNISYTETLCSSYNQTMVLVPIKSCDRLDIAIISSRNNDSETYYKIWIKCWYPNDELQCNKLYPGMIVEKNLTIFYSEPKAYQMWRDVDTCNQHRGYTEGNQIIMSIFCGAFGFGMILLGIILFPYNILKN